VGLGWDIYLFVKTVTAFGTHLAAEDKAFWTRCWTGMSIRTIRFCTLPREFTQRHRFSVIWRLNMGVLILAFRQVSVRFGNKRRRSRTFTIPRSSGGKLLPHNCLDFRLRDIFADVDFKACPTHIGTIWKVGTNL